MVPFNEMGKRAMEVQPVFGPARFQMSVINPSRGVNQTFGCSRDYTLKDSHILELFLE